jgi:predicted O-methyltransferase YrrM
MKRIHEMRPAGNKYESGLWEFCKILKPHFVMVEVGCWAGESTSIFAPYVSKLYAVDPWMPGYDDNDTASALMGKDVEDAFDFRVSLFPHVKKMKMTSEKASCDFENGSIDVVYIDACHTYEAVKADIGFWLPKIRNGGIISGHDICCEPVNRAVIEMLGTVGETFIDDSWMVVR